MKQALAALEVRALEGEFSRLKGAKVNQIYERGPGDYLFQLHLTGLGREIVRINPPFGAYVANVKETGEPGHSAFCSLLRSKLPGLKVRDVAQQGFDRVLKVSFGHDGDLFSLYFEFFGKGNAILVDAQGIVLGAWIERSFGSRSTTKKSPYHLPPAPLDPFVVGDDAILQRIRESRFDHLIKSLAIDLSLGGPYSEEIAARAGIGRQQSPASVTQEQVGALADALRDVLSALRPCVLIVDGKPADVTLFPLAGQQGEHEFYASFSAAQDAFWSRYVAPKKVSAGRQKRETILAQQQIQKEAIVQAAARAQRQGELIYLHYGVVKELLEAVRRLAKEEGWNGVKARYKGHPIIRSVDERRATIVIELGD